MFMWYHKLRYIALRSADMFPQRKFELLGYTRWYLKSFYMIEG